MRIHTSKAPHHCKICPKQFNDSNGLKEHILVHNGANANPPVNQTAEPAAKRPLEFPNIEGAASHSANIQMPPTTVAPVVQWAINQNAATFQMPSIESTFENGSTHNAHSGSSNTITPAQSFDDVSKLFFKAD